MNDATSVSLTQAYLKAGYDKVYYLKGSSVKGAWDDALTDLETLQRIYQQFEARPDSLLVEAMRDRHVSLYVLKP